MNRKLTLVLAAGLMLSVGAGLARGDAAGDLAAGRQALAAGDVDKALPLLVLAAQALPDSVEAQLELARAYLQAGQLDKALGQYRAVLKLSPEHAEARRLVEALTGQKKTFEQKLALARSLMEVGAHSAAAGLLRQLAAGPLEPAQQATVQFALAEAALWQQFTPASLPEIMRAVNEVKGTPQEGPARVMAALSLVSITTPENLAAVAEMLKAIGDQPLPEPWHQRAELVRLLVRLDDRTAAAASAALARPLDTLPPGGLRSEVLHRLIIHLNLIARNKAGQGDLATALRIVWPMLTSAAFPADLDARLAGGAFAPVELTGGWVSPRESDQHRDLVLAALRQIGKAEFDRSGSEAGLFPFWLAAEYLRQLPDDPINRFPIERRLVLIEELAAMSRPPADRKKGQPLSRADELQRALILELASQLNDEALRGRLAAATNNQIARYRSAGDLEAGLKRFVWIEQAGAVVAPAVAGIALKVQPDLPPGPAHRALIESLAGGFASLGGEAFAKAAGGVRPDANAALNEFDAVAIRLYAMLVGLYADCTGATIGGQAIVERYAAAEQWAAATQATTLLYAQRKGDAGKWALARLNIRRAVTLEDKRLAAQQKLADRLDATLAEALAAVLEIVKAEPTDANKSAALVLAGPLIGRYHRLDRTDLAEAVIAALAPRPADVLGDWSLLARADLLAAQAARPLALTAGQFDGAAKLTLEPRHAAALKLLGELVDTFPDSAHAGAAVGRVFALSNTYRQLKAYDVAAAVLTDFLKARPKIDQAEQLRYAVVQVALAKAADAFANRPDKDKPEPPAGFKMLAEHAAALDALAGFLTDYPAGKLAPSAENELIGVARTYGQVGAWPVARDALKRFEAAVPQFRAPERLRLLEAATFLGELDRDYGLALLTPPPPPTPGPAAGWWDRFDDDGRPKPGGEAAKDDLDFHKAVADALKLDPGGGRPLDADGLKWRKTLGAAESPPPPPPAGPAPEPRVSTPARPAQPRTPDEVHEVPGTSLAMIRQSEYQQSQRIARLADQQQGQQGGQGQAGQSGRRGQITQEIVLPAGLVLSEAEMKRQDEASDAAYKILIELVKAHAAEPIGGQARGQVLWLIGFFEGQLRADRAVVMIERFLTDRPTDGARVALAYQAISDRLVWAAQRRPSDRIDQAWVDARHKLFEQARQAINQFVKDYADPKRTDWVNRARMLAVNSFQQEGELVAVVSAPRAAGLLARSADELLALADSQPDHPEITTFPSRLWNLADRLTSLGQRDQAIYVLGRLPVRFPTDALATQAVLRIAGLYATELSAPLRAVETYQEFLALSGDNENIRSHIFSIAGDLTAKQRYLEALHAYGVFVDSFPTDGRAAGALLATGQIHQANEAWQEAIAAYQRALGEYPQAAQAPQIKLATAECQIHLSQWKAARKIYEEYLQQYAGINPANPRQPVAQPAPPQQGGDGLQVAMVQERLETLKSLDRYQTLLADEQVTRNKDDAQFQIGRIVLERLNNRVKAIEEFAKVVKDYPKSDQADDAQFEIGKALLALGRLDKAREALLKVPAQYPTSPLADDALFLVGQSYERQAEQLAAITLEKARDVAFEFGQRGAYQEFQKRQDDQNKQLAERRRELKAGGKGGQLELEEAYNVFRYNPNGDASLSQYSLNALWQAETESALQLANRQDKINEAYREAVAVYARAAKDYPLGTATGETLMRMAEIYETRLKDRRAAMDTYQQIVKFFPGTPVAESAAWKLVKFYEQEGKFDLAVTAYRDFIRTYPASARVAEAQYAMAEALEQLGRWVEAMDAYQTFRDKFASHPKARMAEEQIQWIKAYRK